MDIIVVSDTTCEAKTMTLPALCITLVLSTRVRLARTNVSLFNASTHFSWIKIDVSSLSTIQSRCLEKLIDVPFKTHDTHF